MTLQYFYYLHICSSAKYIGVASNSFKERFSNHTLSFNHQKYQHHTSLSKYVGDLKNKKKPFNISWSIVGKAPPYNPSAKTCKLCFLEKALILINKEDNLLNKRSELMNKCRHREQFLLSNCR